MNIPPKMLQAYKLASEYSNPNSKFDTSVVSVSLKEKHVVVEATDGKRYISVTNPKEEIDADAQFTLRRKAAKELSCGAAAIVVKERKASIEVERDDGKLILRQREDKFPHAITSLIPVEEPLAKVIVDAKLLAELLLVVAEISRGGKNNANSVSLSIYGEGKPLKIKSCQGRFLTTALLVPLSNQVEDEPVKSHLDAPQAEG